MQERVESGTADGKGARYYFTAMVLICLVKTIQKSTIPFASYTKKMVTCSSAF